MRRILLTNRRSPGDVTVMTAAVRDLARSHPGEFAIHVRGSCPELWLHNPHIAGFLAAPRAPDMIAVEADVRAAMRTTDVDRLHYLTAYHRELERRLGVPVPVLLPRGDLHLSEAERSSPLIEGHYWIMVAGGKSDMPVKVWSAARFQTVASLLRFRGIRVVQSGAMLPGHFHPRIEGTVDFRGKRDLRQFLRLVYHADGVICAVSFAMHVAAAFEKPCVALAGGREPWWWEAYVPGSHFGPRSESVRVPHRFLHTIGRLDCCRESGCWRTHVLPEAAKAQRRLCELPIDDGHGQTIPHCLALLDSSEVVDAVLGFRCN